MSNFGCSIYLVEKVVRAACAHPQRNSSDGSNQVGLGQDCQCKENVVESDQRVLYEEHLFRGPRSSRLPQEGHHLSLQRLVESILVEGEGRFALNLCRTFPDIIFLQKGLSVGDIQWYYFLLSTEHRQ